MAKQNYGFIFDIGSQVKVKGLSIKGKISGIFVSKSGVDYQVRYFYLSEPKTCYFQADDLELMDENDIALGFNNK